MIAYKGNPAQRRALQGDLRMGQFLKTYDYIIKDRPHLSKLNWVHMVIGLTHSDLNNLLPLLLPPYPHWNSSSK
jgi:hypothetical protein